MKHTDSPSHHDSILVIGYGNDLRGDDGAGRLVADIVETWRLPYVRTVSVPQLVPETAEEIAEARLVIFVDAYPARAGWPVHAMPIEPRETCPTFGHQSDPSSMLRLSQLLYGHCPEAWMVGVPGVGFDCCEGLSETTEAAVYDAVGEVRKLVELAHGGAQ